MAGFLPPISSDNFLKEDAVFSAINFPVAVPPVNETALIFG